MARSRYPRSALQHTIEFNIDGIAVVAEGINLPSVSQNGVLHRLKLFYMLYSLESTHRTACGKNNMEDLSLRMFHFGNTRDIIVSFSCLYSSKKRVRHKQTRNGKSHQRCVSIARNMSYIPSQPQNVSYNVSRQTHNVGNT